MSQTLPFMSIETTLATILIYALLMGVSLRHVMAYNGRIHCNTLELANQSILLCQLQTQVL